MHIIGTYVLSMSMVNIVQTYKGYNTLPCFFYSLGAFIVLEETGRKVMKINALKK